MIGISPQQKNDPQKKREKKKRSKDWKGGETSVEKLHVLRRENKERMKFTSC
jgi:hypothetical protein